MMEPERDGGRLLWGRCLAGAVLILVLLAAGSVIFVFLHSQFMVTGESQAYYQKFARDTGAPFVALFGPLVTFLVSLWVLRKAPAKAVANAVLLAIVILVIEVVGLVLVGESAFILHPANVIANVAKLLGVAAGALVVRREYRRATA